MSQRIGRIQLRVRPLQIADLLPRCYPRVQKRELWHRWNVHRALRKYAVRLGRAKHGRGLPIIWGPNSELKRQIASNEHRILNLLVGT